MPAPRLEGIFPPIPTFFKPNEALELQAIKEHIRNLAEAGLHGATVLGSGGEFASLSREERLEVLKAAIDAAPSGFTIIAGVGAPSTKLSLEMARCAQELGAHAVIAVAPYYVKPSDEGLLQHYRSIRRGIDLPLLAYNIPPFTGLNLGFSLVAKLMEEGVIDGIKESSGDVAQMMRLINHSEERDLSFSLLAGNDPLLALCLALGGAGGIVGLANALPKHYLRIFNAMKEGNHREAFKLQRKLQPLIDATKVANFPAGIKYLVERTTGLPSTVRSPLLPLKEDQKRLLDERLEEFLEASKAY